MICLEFSKLVVSGNAFDSFQELVAALGHRLDALRRKLKLCRIGSPVLAFVSPSNCLDKELRVYFDLALEIRDPVVVSAIPGTG
jgi:hypothetical protein